MNKKVAIVLGAHRSGTSLLTAGLESLGAYLSITSDYKNEENPKGFFENEAIVNFNDRLLEYLGGRWDNPLFDGKQALSAKKKRALIKWYDEADSIFKSNFSEHSFVAIKDPRMCQLLPFWTGVLQQNGYSGKNTYYVHIGRYPLEIAQSQYKRKQLKPEFHFLGEKSMETVSLWMSMSYQSLRDLNSDYNIFLLYDDLLNNPKDQLERLAKFLGVACAGERVEEYCSSFVEKGLRRNVADWEADDELSKEFPEAKVFYLKQKKLASKDCFSRSDAVDVLKAWPQSPMLQHFLNPIVPLFSELVSQRVKSTYRVSELEGQLEQVKLDRDQTRSEFEKALKQVESERSEVVSELEGQLEQVKLDRDQTRSEFEKALKQVESERSEVVSELAVIKSSFSWRVLKPLRRLQSLGRGK